MAKRRRTDDDSLVGDTALTIATSLARKFFRKQGDTPTVSLTEVELTALIALSIEVGTGRLEEA